MTKAGGAPQTVLHNTGVTHMHSRKKGTSHQTNKGPWLYKFKPEFQEFYDHVKMKFFQGDTKLLAARSKLFGREVYEPAMLFAREQYPHMFKWYAERFGRELEHTHLMGRIRYLFVRYYDGKKWDFRRSKEHPWLIA